MSVRSDGTFASRQIDWTRCEAIHLKARGTVVQISSEDKTVFARQNLYTDRKRISQLQGDLMCFLETLRITFSYVNMGSSKKSCSKGILESCGLPGAKRIFVMEY